MPEVPLWKLKIDGQEYPPPQEGDETEQVTSPPVDDMPFEAEDLQEWYASRKEEYEKFMQTPEATFLGDATKEFLSKPDVGAFLKRVRGVKGPGSWLVLRTLFDKCKDETLIDAIVAELWKPALDWVQHEKHRKITSIEMNDLWRHIDEMDRKDPPAEEPEDSPGDPEFDDNYRFIGRGEEE